MVELTYSTLFLHVIDVEYLVEYHDAVVLTHVSI